MILMAKPILKRNRIILSRELNRILKERHIKRTTFDFVYQFVDCGEKRYCEGCVEDTLAIITTVLKEQCLVEATPYPIKLKPL